MSGTAQLQGRPLRRTPGRCTDCDCAEFEWNGHNYVLRTDEPHTCRCGHRAARHSYLDESDGT